MSRSRLLSRLLAVAASAALIVACGSAGGADEPTDAATTVRGEIMVFAAASLTESFTAIGAAFEAAHPESEVVFNFAGSPTLRVQIEEGARADVYASANPAQMELTRAAGLVEGEAPIFVNNALVIITPADNPAGIESAADLARAGLKLIVANAAVPVGAYTVRMLASLSQDPAYGGDFSERVLANAVSLESNVKQVVAKVELGEADAGVVYGSDVTPAVAPELGVIELPDEFNVIAEYPIAVLAEAGNPAGGQAFIDFILSAAGQSILAAHGFRSPS